MFRKRKGAAKMENNGRMTIEEHFYWITAVAGLLMLAIFMTFSNPNMLG
jgi:hypothetical protein